MSQSRPHDVSRSLTEASHFRIMISGPMSGLPDFNRPAFHEAARALEQRGYAVLNPARQPDGLTWEEYMRRSITDVCASDAIALLPGWEVSPGALVEVDLARRLNIPVSTLNEWLQVEAAKAS